MTRSESIRTRKGPNKALSQLASIALFTMIVIVVAAATAIGYNMGSSAVNQSQSNSSELTSLQNQVNNIQSKLSTLPTMNQAPVVRNIKVEWSNTENAGQDRYYEPIIEVNQGDTVAITFVSNDSDAHTFTLESPYDFQMNATVPGTRNFLDHEAVFTTNATNNSPGVKVSGTPGNVTATGSFVAKYSGIYEYFCIYHVQFGMFGYLIVLPNAAYSSANSSQTTTVSTPSKAVQVSIVSGAGNNESSPGYSPSTITVVIGVNNTVSWTNNDLIPHTVTASDGSFSSGNMNPGDSFAYTFTTPGTYTYHCSYHSWMKGTVIVKSS
jgi:plastocyanin